MVLMAMEIRLPDKCSVGMHELVGIVKNGQRVQASAWVHGQLAKGWHHAIFNEEMMNVGLLAARDSTSELTIISDRKEPIKLALTLQMYAKPSILTNFLNSCTNSHS